MPDDKERLMEQRISKIESDVHELFEKFNTLHIEYTATISKLSTELQNINKTMIEIQKSLEVLKSKPSKLWERLIFGLIGAITAGLGTAIVSLVIH